MGKFCFIISEIGKIGEEGRTDADRKREHLFKPVLQELKIEFKRADEESTPGFISTQIVKRLIDSDLVLADISTANANVFYELAIRHAVKKPVIIIKNLGQSPPFDVKDIRAIDVDMTKPEVWEPAKITLKKYIEEAISNPEKASESILSDFTFKLKTDTKEETESEILRKIKDLQSEIRRMGKKIDENARPSLETPFYLSSPLTSTNILAGETIGETLEGKDVIVACKNCNERFTVQGPLTFLAHPFMCNHCFQTRNYTQVDVIPED